MSKRFYSLIKTLLPNKEFNVVNQCEKMCENCFYFIKNELALMSFIYRMLIYLLIYFFFVYCFICSGFRDFKKLSKEKQEALISNWEELWPPGYILFRLLRSLIYLRYFDQAELE